MEEVYAEAVREAESRIPAYMRRWVAQNIHNRAKGRLYNPDFELTYDMFQRYRALREELPDWKECIKQLVGGDASQTCIGFLDE